MELELKITCTCHQAKIPICCQTPLVAPIALKICTRGFFSALNPKLQSDLLSDHSSNTSFKTAQLEIPQPLNNTYVNESKNSCHSYHTQMSKVFTQPLDRIVCD